MVEVERVKEMSWKERRQLLEIRRFGADIYRGEALWGNPGPGLRSWK